jgi:hypothetical protein
MRDRQDKARDPYNVHAWHFCQIANSAVRKLHAVCSLPRVLPETNEIDTCLLQDMAYEGKEWIVSFPWCAEVLESYFGGGLGGVFAVFFFHIRPSRGDIDPWL